MKFPNETVLIVAVVLLSCLSDSIASSRNYHPLVGEASKITPDDAAHYVASVNDGSDSGDNDKSSMLRSSGAKDTPRSRNEDNEDDVENFTMKRLLDETTTRRNITSSNITGDSLFWNESVPTSAAPSMAPTQAPTFLGAISPDCRNATDLLSEDEELTMALESLLEEYRQEFQDTCPLALTNTVCDVTYGGNSNNTLYYNMCLERGGQIFEHGVILQCGLPPLNIDQDLGVVPQCIANECDMLADNFDISVLGTNENITNFAASLDNGGCAGKVESSAYWHFNIGCVWSAAATSVIGGFVLETLL